ncbi:hypothetical protein E2562_020724, partial [Oryza meyeriana var. granulata]
RSYKHDEAATGAGPGEALRVLRGVPRAPGEPARPRGVRLAHPPHGAAPAPLRAAAAAVPILLPALPPVPPRPARLPRRRLPRCLLRAHGPTRGYRRRAALRRWMGRREPPRRRRGALDARRRLEAVAHRPGPPLVRPVLRPRILREAAAGAGRQPGAGGGDDAVVRLPRGAAQVVRVRADAGVLQARPGEGVGVAERCISAVDAEEGAEGEGEQGGGVGAERQEGFVGRSTQSESLSLRGML